MYTNQDWLSLHQLNPNLIWHLLNLIEAGGFHALIKTYLLDVEIADSNTTFVPASQSDVYHQYLKPALISYFEEENKETINNILSNKIKFTNPENLEDLPFTLFQGKNKAALISMSWSGKEEDWICLAHEVGHALQLHLSISEMPPIAREVCAFLCEMILLEHLKVNQNETYQKLLITWLNQNEFYIHDCADLLIDAINYADNQYHYYQNYPIAKIISILIYSSKQVTRVKQLFASGLESMGLINKLIKLDQKVESLDNDIIGYSREYIPEGEKIDAYTALGIMALLFKNHVDASISCFYNSVARNLVDGTSFIGLSTEKIPIGYATFKKEADGVFLTEQVSSFNNRKELQDALKKHIEAVEQKKVNYIRDGLEGKIVWSN